MWAQWAENKYVHQIRDESIREMAIWGYMGLYTRGYRLCPLPLCPETIEKKGVRLWAQLLSRAEDM